MEFTPEYLKSLKSEYAANASQDQFDLWISDCKLRGLIPVRDVVLQVRGVKEWDSEVNAKVFKKKSIYITTIAALRKLAERTGKYAGQLPSQWIYLDDDSNPSVVSDVPLPDSQKKNRPRTPWAAKASVLRKGFEHPITVPARFEAYAQYYKDGNDMSLNSTWANRGPEQLEKCAEALALRKAFPEELSGLFLQEEIRDEQDVHDTEQSTSVQEIQPPQVEQKKRGRKPKVDNHEVKVDKRTEFPFGENDLPAATKGGSDANPEPPPPFVATDEDVPDNIGDTKPATPQVNPVVSTQVNDVKGGTKADIPTEEQYQAFVERLKKYISRVGNEPIKNFVLKIGKVKGTRGLTVGDWKDIFAVLDSGKDDKELLEKIKEEK